MKTLTLALTLGAAMMAMSCASISSEDQKFETLARDYLERYLELNPETATILGDHRYDHRLNDYGAAGVGDRLDFNKKSLESLERIDPRKLGTANRIDYAILKNNIESSIFELETLRPLEWNPLAYNVGGAIYSLLAREFAPLEQRLLSVRHRLEAVPEVVALAKANLKNPPRVHTETAIQQNQGNIALIGEGLDHFLEQAPELRRQIEPVREKALNALEYYGSWLEKDLLPESNGEFRLGEKKFRKKLRYTLHSELDMEEILTRAKADLATTHDDMFETATELFDQYFPGRSIENTPDGRKTVIKAVLGKLAGTRPTNATVVDRARECLDRCSEFVVEQDLVRVPEEPIELIVMPEFQRGVAVAYCDAPGPLDRASQTFFAISPTPEDWSEERTDSFYREYNDYMLNDLTIHEAMPGHYLQLAHANRFEAPTMIRAIYASGTFVEGWATYVEQLMVEKGYGGAEVRLQQLKMRLRMIINAIIDQKIHTAGMTEEEAVSMMMNEGFQEEGEAAGKWRRACLTSTQLSTYYVGNIEVNDIRRAFERKNGAGGDLRRMHDEMLSFGSPPPKYVRELMGL